MSLPYLGSMIGLTDGLLSQQNFIVSKISVHCDLHKCHNLHRFHV